MPLPNRQRSSSNPLSRAAASEAASALNSALLGRGAAAVCVAPNAAATLATCACSTLSRSASSESAAHRARDGFLYQSGGLLHGCDSKIACDAFHRMRNALAETAVVGFEGLGYLFGGISLLFRNCVRRLR